MFISYNLCRYLGMPSRLGYHLILIGRISGKLTLKIQNDYVLAFFDQYLKGERSDLLNDSTRKYEEVVFKSRNTQSGQILLE
jgi:hypothetical protein